jgi:tetratricopeptide (TPR) repeat protein
VIEQILLADRHLQVDQVDKARDIYQRVVDADPGNAIAVVGLARCALADGDDHRAYGLAAQALEIDPENDMARRMEARLSEILTNRGEAVDRPDVAATPSPREMRQVVTEPAAQAPAATASGASETEPTRPAPGAERPAEPTTADTAPVKPPAAKEPPVRKSLFDRLMGR